MPEQMGPRVLVNEFSICFELLDMKIEKKADINNIYLNLKKNNVFGYVGIHLWWSTNLNHTRKVINNK